MNVNIALSKLKLFKELEGNRMHILTFGIYKDNLRIYVKEADRNNMRDAKLVCNMAVMSMNSRLLVEELRELHTREDKYKFELGMFGPKWVDNKRVEGEMVKMGSVGLVRANNKDGKAINILYIESNIGTKYIFPLIPTPFVTISRNGKIVDDATALSNMWTTAYCKSFEGMLNLYPEGLHDLAPSYGTPQGVTVKQQPSTTGSFKEEDLSALL